MGQLGDVWASWVMYGPLEWGTGQWGDVWSSWVVYRIVGVMYGPMG